jgi:hypothetical protein
MPFSDALRACFHHPTNFFARREEISDGLFFPSPTQSVAIFSNGIFVST